MPKNRKEKLFEVILWDNYTIYEDGRIWSRQSKRFLKSSTGSAGYRQVCLCSNKEQHWGYIHRLVAAKFIPNPKNNPCINHKNGVKSDNRICNLEWVTYKENTQHAINTKLKIILKGEKAYSSKLTEEEVLKIIHLKKTTKITYPKLALMFGVNRITCVKIVMRKTWKHVKVED